MEEFSSLTGPIMASLTRFAATVGPRGSAEDLVQDALLRAWSKRDRFDPSRGTLLAWVLGFVSNQAKSSWRAGPRIAPVLSDLQVSIASASSELSIDLRRAIGDLSPAQRTAVILYYYVDLSIEDTASVLKRSPGTVKSTLHDARRNLAARLGVEYV